MLLLLLCLAIFSPANSMKFFGLDPLGVNFCCGEDETLVVRRQNRDRRVAECVGTGGGKGSSLEGKQVWVGGEADGEMKSLKLLEVSIADPALYLLTFEFLNQCKLSSSSGEKARLRERAGSHNCESEQN